MGDQKDHATIQKKETDTASNENVVQNFDTATESLPPPTLQLKADASNEVEEESKSTEGGSNSPFQFSLAPPPDENGGEGSKVIDGNTTIQKKGVAEPFKMPIVQKKVASTPSTIDKPSFKL